MAGRVATGGVMGSMERTCRRCEPAAAVWSGGVDAAGGRDGRWRAGRKGPTMEIRTKGVGSEEGGSGTDAGHGMSCMEIWGGNVSAETGVSTPGIDAYVFSRPHAGSVGGGDIHYVSLCAAGRIARFALADVSGHGGEVSDLAVELRGLMRRHINTPDQARFARDLNEAFSRSAVRESIGGGRFATAILATYWTPTDHLIVCNAGHPRPLWYRASERRWVVMREEAGLGPGAGEETGIRNLPLGVIDPTDYTQWAYGLERGDLVVMMTDALTEATSPSGEMLGEEGVMGLCEGLDAGRPEGFIEGLLRAVRAFRGGGELEDDVTVLLLHHNGAEPPKYSLKERVAMVGRMLGW